MTTTFDITIVGAGVIGLAVGASLAKLGKQVLILESGETIGHETSSRNSGVIHAGIYYKKNSLKARTCLRGKELLYGYLKEHKISHKKLGKYIIANMEESEKLEGLLGKGFANGVTDLKLFNKAELANRIPQANADLGIYSPSSGILDVPGYMQSLLGELRDHGGDLAVLSKFTSARKINENSQEWEVNVGLGSDETADKQTISIKTNFVINAAGLYAEKVAKKIDPMPKHLIPSTHFTKGNYFVVRGSCPFKNLIYPLPEKGGLGIHLTLDLGGQTLLGPDVEPIPISIVEKDFIDNKPEFNYAVEEKRKPAFYESVKKWWPDLRQDQLQSAYSGIRPKLNKIAEAPADFVLQGPGDNNVPGLYNFFGIESPGITASLAIAEIITDDIKNS